MTTLAEFHSMVGDEVNKGTRYDSVIPRFTRRAARFIERNYNFLYMERFAELDLDLSSPNPRFVAFPSEETKKVNFVRYPRVIGGSNQQEYVYLSKVDPIDVVSIEPETRPRGYWQTGDATGANFLVLDQVGTDELTFEVHYIEFSTWSTDTGSTHWLLNNAEDVMIAQTMRMMAPYANEPDWIMAYKAMWEEGIRTLTMVDEEARNAGTADGYKMVYR